MVISTLSFLLCDRIPVSILFFQVTSKGFLFFCTLCGFDNLPFLDWKCFFYDNYCDRYTVIPYGSFIRFCDFLIKIIFLFFPPGFKIWKTISSNFEVNHYYLPKMIKIDIHVLTNSHIILRGNRNTSLVPQVKCQESIMDF